MIASSQPFVRRLRVPGYVIFGLTFLLPLIDLIISSVPLHPGLLQWRFQTFGLLVNAMSAPIFMLALLYALALAAGDRKMVVAIAVVAAIFCLLTIGGAGTFFLDALQMKRRVPVSALPRFESAMYATLIKYALFAPALLIFAVSAFRTSRMERVIPGADREKEGGLLVGVRPDKRRSSPNVATAPAMAPGDIDALPVEPPMDDAMSDPMANPDLPGRSAPKSTATRPSVGSFPPPPRKGDM